MSGTTAPTLLAQMQMNRIARPITAANAGIAMQIPRVQKAEAAQDETQEQAGEALAAGPRERSASPESRPGPGRE